MVEVGKGSAESGTTSVFVSYASQDAVIANRVVEACERAGLKCWIAPRDVSPGAFYADEIVSAINASRVLLLILTANACVSAHVLREVERASAKRHPVVSFRIDAAPLPTGLEYFLSASHWLDASKSGVESQLPNLVAAVQRLLVPGAPLGPSMASDAKVGVQPGISPPVLKVKHRGWGRLAIVTAAIMVLGVVWWAADRWRLTKPNSSAPPVVAITQNQPPVPTIEQASIAVLPFADMSEQKNQEYFADGLSEELIDHLAHTRLKVIARTSSFVFKGKNEDVRSIAAKLGVAHLLEGSIRKAGNDLRITAQLIRASDGVHLWSAIYDRKLTDIFKLQDEISTTVAKALDVALNLASGANSAKPANETTEVAAYNLFLKGTFFYHHNEPGDNNRAIDYFQQAIKLDPQYAAAWARIARVYAWQGLEGEITPAEAERRGMQAALRALAIDPNCAEAYYARGNIYRLILGDWTAAASDYTKSVALDSQGDVAETARYTLAILSAALSGKYRDLIAWAKSSLTRNPLDTDTMEDLAWYQVLDGSLDDSIVTIQKLFDLNPAYLYARAQYGIQLLLLHRNDEALAESTKEIDEASKLQALACVYWAMGRKAESNMAMESLEGKFADRHAYEIAATHAFRGDTDTAFAWLDRVFLQRRGALVDIKADPLLSKLRGDPRFGALVRKANLGSFGS